LKASFARSKVPLIVCSLASNEQTFLFVNSAVVNGPIEIIALTSANDEATSQESLLIITKKDLTAEELVKTITSIFFSFKSITNSYQILSMLAVNTSYINNSSTIIPRAISPFRTNSFDAALLGIMTFFPLTPSFFKNNFIIPWEEYISGIIATFIPFRFKLELVLGPTATIVVEFN